ncbi:MAG: SPOR domain-containing protein [Pontixanthobacter sp.]
MVANQDNGYGDNRDGEDYSEEPIEGAEYGEGTDMDQQDEPSLVADDEPLPWLESDYDGEDEGPDTARLVGFGLLGFLALALLLAAAWYFLRDKPDPDLIADGSTIEAPSGPMKERPEDAGGKQFEGTGNIAPTVGEGQTTEGRLAPDAAPGPSIDVTSTSAPTPAAAAPSAGGIGVQVGAYSSQAGANAAWTTLAGQTDALKGFQHRVVEGKVDGGSVFRLQAVAGDAAAANRLCTALKSDGIACQVKN